jgi:hypothetical protein
MQRLRGSGRAHEAGDLPGEAEEWWGAGGSIIFSLFSEKFVNEEFPQGKLRFL